MRRASRIISESTAAAFFPGQDPIGKRIKAASFNANQRDPEGAWRTIVGVVGNVRYGVSTRCSSTCTTRRRRRPSAPTSLVVRMKTGEEAKALRVAAAIQTQAKQRDPRVLVSGITMLEDVVNKEIAPWRFSAWVFALFAALAFALSMLGLFSLVSLDVANRRQEFAIRMAVGAHRRHIVGGVFRSAGVRAAIGIAADAGGRGAARSLQACCSASSSPTRDLRRGGDRWWRSWCCSPPTCRRAARPLRDPLALLRRE